MIAQPIIAPDHLPASLVPSRRWQVAGEFIRSAAARYIRLPQARELRPELFPVALGLDLSQAK